MYSYALPMEVSAPTVCMVWPRARYLLIPSQ